MKMQTCTPTSAIARSREHACKHQRCDGGEACAGQCDVGRVRACPSRRCSTHHSVPGLPSHSPHAGRHEGTVGHRAFAPAGELPRYSARTDEPRPGVVHQGGIARGPTGSTRRSACWHTSASFSCARSSEKERRRRMTAPHEGAVVLLTRGAQNARAATGDAARRARHERTRRPPRSRPHRTKVRILPRKWGTDGFG